jgi:hypothetical protein
MRVFDIFSQSQKQSVTDTQVTDPAPISEEIDNPVDRVTMDIPLLLRIMEYSKEDAKTDMDLHHVVEKLISLSTGGQVLNMGHYNEIVSSLNEMGGSEAEELIKSISHDTVDQTQPEFSIKKYAVQSSQGMPLVRFKIIKQNGMPATDHVFDTVEDARKYLKTFFNTEIDEGHGRYWCSTDKRWKERQGPKQSRS